MRKGWVIGLIAGVVLGGAGGYLLAGRRAGLPEKDLVEALHALGLPDRARAPWEDLHKQHPDDPVARAGLALAHFREGQRLERTGDFAGAIGAFGEAARLEPTIYYFHLALGNAYVSEGRLDLGLRAFDEGLRLEPTSVGSNLQAFHVRLQLGKPDEAKADLERLEQAARTKQDLARALPDLYEKLALAFEQAGAADAAGAARQRAEALRR